MIYLLTTSLFFIAWGIVKWSRHHVRLTSHTKTAMFFILLGVFLFGLWLGLAQPARGSYSDGYQHGIEDCQINARFTRQ